MHDSPNLAEARQRTCKRLRALNLHLHADLPVQQSIRVQLVLNLKTAKTLGIKLPLTLHASADEVRRAALPSARNP
jgi:putative ABC transport system substrate-binding protein